MITLKSAHELALMREAGRIVAEVLAEIQETVAPGVTTGDLEAIADEIIVGKYGAIPSFKGYRGFPGYGVCLGQRGDRARNPWAAGPERG